MALTDDPAALVASVLDEEAKREAEQAANEQGVVLPDDLLPGVGGEPMPLRDVLRVGGRSTIGVLFFLGMADNLVNNGAFQVLAPDIQEALLSLPGVEQGKPEISEKGLRPVSAEVDWTRQRGMMAVLV